MVSTFTPNINLEEPARGDDVGTWDTPVNNNMTLADLVIGGGVTIGLNNSPVVLASAQFQCSLITFNSTLTGSVAITFPSTFKKTYTVRHTCTGSSAFVITLQTTAAGGQVLACRPGNPFQCYNDGTNLFFINLGTEVGGYWDYAGSSVPNWVSGCTVPPYLNCDGTAFSSATYPQLANIMGTTLPNSKGRTRFTLDQGAGLISTAVFTSSAVGATGGNQTQAITLGSSNLPASIPYKDGGHIHSVTANAGAGGGTYGSGTPSFQNSTFNTASALIGITINPSTAAAGTGNAFTTVTTPPAYIGGLTLIRAA